MTIREVKRIIPSHCEIMVRLRLNFLRRLAECADLGLSVWRVHEESGVLSGLLSIIEVKVRFTKHRSLRPQTANN